jgi:hypothetical protein
MTTDAELRAIALRKVQWETLSLDSRRRILEPVSFAGIPRAGGLTHLR